MRQTTSKTYQRVQFLLEREQLRSMRSQRGDVYTRAGREASIENDEISSVEEGFMQGYLAA